MKQLRSIVESPVNAFGMVTATVGWLDTDTQEEGFSEFVAAVGTGDAYYLWLLNPDLPPPIDASESL